MNFGQNMYNWLIGNLQPVVLLALAVTGVTFFVERKFAKIAGLIIVGIIAVGFVFDASGVKDLFLQLFQSFFGAAAAQ